MNLRKITLTTVLLLFLSIASLVLFDLDGLQAQHANIPPQLRPFRPFPIRIANAIGYLLQRANVLHLLLPLDEQQLITNACAQAQNIASRHGSTTLLLPHNCPLLQDDSTAEWRIGLQTLLTSLNTEGQLTLFGRYFATQQIGDALKRRALVQLHWAMAPLDKQQWKNETIHHPIFIVGLPRTGTTFLQELLGQDQTLRTLKMWELMEPVFPIPPSPSDIQSYSSPSILDKISQVQWNLDQYKRLAPGLDAWHPVHAMRPEECILTLASTFDSQQYSATYNVPSYNQWLHNHSNHTYAMQWHKNLLKTLQFHSALSFPQETKTQWVLKTPYFLPLLEDIRATYPDALIIHTHRNPEQVLASAASVHTKTFGIVSDVVDLQRIGAEQVELQRIFLSKAMATREKWSLENEPVPNTNTGFRVLDVHLKELQEDTMGQVRHIFKTLLGRTLTQQNSALMKEWLRANKRGKHGKHTFDKKVFGIDVHGDVLFDKYAAQFSTMNSAKIAEEVVRVGVESKKRKSSGGGGKEL